MTGNSLATRARRPLKCESTQLSLVTGTLAAPAPLFEFEANTNVNPSEHPVAVYVASLASGSRRAMLGCARTIAHIISGGRLGWEEFPWAKLRFQHTVALRAILVERYALATARLNIAALKGILKAAWRLGQMPQGVYLKAIDLPAIRGKAAPRGRQLTIVELRALFEACVADANRPRTVTAGCRDAAMLAVMCGTGLRRREVVNLDLADYNPMARSIEVRQGKGAKHRTVYTNDLIELALTPWLERRGNRPGPLFTALTNWGKLTDRRLHDQSVLDILNRRATGAGVKTFSPHEIRKTFISNALDVGIGLEVVAKMAGHENPNTTANYDRRGDRAQRDAAQLIPVPYVGPANRKRAALAVKRWG